MRILAPKPFDLAIVGEVNMDLILYGLPSVMPVERELLGTDFRTTLGGSSAIVAHNTAILGPRVTFTCLLGKDDLGSLALARLRSAGVDLSHVLYDESRCTGVSLLLPHGSERHILTYPGTIEFLSTAMLDLTHLASARHLHLTSLYLQKALHPGLPEMLSNLKDFGLTLSLDTNDDPQGLWGAPLQQILPLLDCFLPSESEICRMTHTDSIEAAVDALDANIPTIVVKRGSRGASVFANGMQTHIEPIRVSPVDTIGAGDSFDAGFLTAWLRGRDPVTCARAGNITGALSTRCFGGTEAFRDISLRNRFLSDHGFFDLIGL